MRISDWSSDVCSSDLHLDRLVVDDIAAGIEQSVLPVAGIGVERDVGQDADIIAARILDRRHRAAHQIVGVERLRAVVAAPFGLGIGKEREAGDRSEEHTSELQSLMRISYAVFCLKKKNKNTHEHS